jgi:hypothetical protein
MSLGLDLDKHVTPVAMFILCPHYTQSFLLFNIILLFTGHGKELCKHRD